MPRTIACCQDAPLVQLSGDSPHAGEPLRPQVIHDGPQVGCAVLRVRTDGSHSLLVADLLAPKRSCPIGIAKLDPTGLGSGQSCFGTLTDQPRFQFGNRGHLGQQEAPHGSWWNVGQVAEHEVNIARHKGAQQVDVAGQAVKLREHHGSPDGLGVRESFRKLWTVTALAALSLKGVDLIGDLPDCLIIKRSKGVTIRAGR